MIWVKRLFKFFMIVGLILAFLLFVLSMMGGNNETLKSALQDFLSEATNTEVTIGKLNHVGFYPDIAFDFEDVTGRAGEAEELDVFKVGSVRLVMGFWDMTFSQEKIKDITIENIYMAPGLWGDKIVSLENLAIAPSNETAGGAAFIGSGVVGDKAFKVFVEMVAVGDAMRPVYKFSGDKKIDFTLGDSKARLSFHNGEADLEPIERGDDYCDLVELLDDLDVKFAHNCDLSAPVEEPQLEATEPEITEGDS